MSFKEHLKILNQVFNGLQKAQKNWNITDFHKYSDRLKDISQRMPQILRDYLSQSDNNMIVNQEALESASYQVGLEDAMRLKELPFEGKFPNYTIGPFKLEVAIPKHVIAFKFGRKVKRFNFLEPNAVAKAISSYYRKIVKRPFEVLDNLLITGNVPKIKTEKLIENTIEEDTEYFNEDKD